MNLKIQNAVLILSLLLVGSVHAETPQDAAPQTRTYTVGADSSLTIKMTEHKDLRGGFLSGENAPAIKGDVTIELPKDLPPDAPLEEIVAKGLPLIRTIQADLDTGRATSMDSNWYRAKVANGAALAFNAKYPSIKFRATEITSVPGTNSYRIKASIGKFKVELTGKIVFADGKASLRLQGKKTLSGAEVTKMGSFLEAIKYPYLLRTLPRNAIIDVTISLEPTTRRVVRKTPQEEPAPARTASQPVHATTF
jgi:hypothetical protein